MRERKSLALVLSLVLVGMSAARAQDKNTLLIAPGDVLHVQVADTPEMEEHARVTDQGNIPVIGIGDVKVSGLSPAEAAQAVHDKLIASHYLNHPQVFISVEQYATQLVSVIGEVKTTGAYPIATPRPVLDVLALAGGLTTEANRHILIERHGDQKNPIPYYVSNNGAQAITDQVLVNPGDTVFVPRAGIVFILGDVNRPGGYVMSNNESELTVLEGLALAGGPTKTAKEAHAHLIRPRAGGGYSDTEFNVADLEKGKKPDWALDPGDIVYVQFSFARNFANGASGIAATTAGAALYAIP
ncbi:MAG TPA: polysaccharide biosynthesis/export family protein [Terracidiphilus sp.]|nr:polysaccharide biosynthesis/export family protein [Terracidiphilus sp.]